LYEKTCRKAQKWQINLLKPMLARTVKGLWFQTNFGYAVPRRNGKNEVVAMRELFGLASGETILHTAHRTTTSHTVLERLCMLLDKAKIQHESLRAAGRERIDTESGGRLALSQLLPEHLFRSPRPSARSVHPSGRGISRIHVSSIPPSSEFFPWTCPLGVAHF